MRAFIILLSAIFLVVQAIDVIQERNSNHYHHDPYQYTHVKNPGVYEWGYNRGNHAGHSRSQVLKAAHHNHFQSEVHNIQFFLLISFNLFFLFCFPA